MADFSIFALRIPQCECDRCKLYECENVLFSYTMCGCMAVFGFTQCENVKTSAPAVVYGNIFLKLHFMFRL